MYDTCGKGVGKVIWRMKGLGWHWGFEYSGKSLKLRASRHSKRRLVREE